MAGRLSLDRVPLQTARKTASRSPRFIRRRIDDSACFESFGAVFRYVDWRIIRCFQMRLDLIEKIREELGLWQNHQVLTYSLMVVSRDDDDGCFGIAFTELIRQLNAADTRHT